MRAVCLDAIPGSQYRVLLNTLLLWSAEANPSRDPGTPCRPHMSHPTEGWELVHFKYQRFQPASYPPSPLPPSTCPGSWKKPSDRVTDTCSRKSLACKSYGKENSGSDRNHKIRQNLVRGRPTPESVFLTMDIFYNPAKWFVNILSELQKRRSC